MTKTEYQTNKQTSDITVKSNKVFHTFYFLIIWPLLTSFAGEHFMNAVLDMKVTVVGQGVHDVSSYIHLCRLVAQD